MTYPKQRKQSSKLFKKNKTKVRKTKKLMDKIKESVDLENNMEVI